MLIDIRQNVKQILMSETKEQKANGLEEQRKFHPHSDFDYEKRPR